MSNKPQIITLSSHELELIEQYGAANFTIRQIAKLLRRPYVMMKKELRNTDSIAYEHYERGILQKKADIAVQIAQKARAGGMTAIQQDDKFRREAEFERIKSEIFDL